MCLYSVLTCGPTYNQALYQASKYTSDQAPIYGGSAKVPQLAKLLKDKDEFTIGDNLHVKFVLLTPSMVHTVDGAFQLQMLRDPLSHTRLYLLLCDRQGR